MNVPAELRREANPLDGLLAEFLRARAPAGAADAVALAAALASRERALGHSCVVLDRWAGEPADGGRGTFPEAKAWVAALGKAPGVVGDGRAVTPLVLEGGRLYLYRYWAAERRIADAVRARLEHADPPAASADRKKAFRTLFRPAGDGETDWQAVAAASALRHRLCVITGGPGTGKTTVVTRILALFLSLDPRLTVAMAAPTGKGAARLTEAVSSGAAGLPLDAAVGDRIAGLKAMTLHRLLGYRPEEDRFRAGPSRPLSADLVVVDEASMVDLLLMDALFAAARPDARILLLGDRDQLSSVETGTVLGDLSRAADTAGPHGAAFAAFVKALGGGSVPATREKTPALRDAVVELTRNWRFPAHPEIGSLAGAVRAGDGASSMEILRSSTRNEVAWFPLPRDPARLLDPIEASLESLSRASSPAEALQRLSEFRILCAVRRGPWSVEHLNALVEKRLGAVSRGSSGRWYRGRPVLVTSNDAAVKLFNGDLGVCWPEGGVVRAWFPTEDAGAPRPVAVSKLPDHETSWAMTVHKSQGSETDRVLLVLPAQTLPLLTRELVYTAVTRARAQVTVFAPEDVFRAAVSRSAVRVSGLAEALARP